MLDVLRNKHSVRFEIDSGSKYTVIDVAEYQKLKSVPELQPTYLLLTAYDGVPLTVLGEVLVNASFRNRQFQTTLIVVKRGKAVLGRLWFPFLGIKLSLVNSIASITEDIKKHTKNSLISEFASTFQQKTGMTPIPKISFKLQPNARPKFINFRQVPFALRDATNKELDKLGAEGIITPLENAGSSTPLVVIPKVERCSLVC